MNEFEDVDVHLLQKYCGRKSDMGKLVQRLRKVYQGSKSEGIQQIEEIMGESSSNTSAAVSECGETAVEVPSTGMWFSIFTCTDIAISPTPIYHRLIESA